MTPHAPIHNFSHSLHGGQSGEQMLAAAYPDHLELLDGKIADLRDRHTGKTIELKTMTDRRLGDHVDWANNITNSFFVERWSDIHAKLDGGPWRAARNHVDFYWYLFPLDRIVFTYPTIPFLKRTIQRTEGKLSAWKPDIINQTALGDIYHTAGWVVPLADYSDLLIKRFVVP